MVADKLVSLASPILNATRKEAGRAVHIKIHPRPSNLAESRELLRVLQQQYGEIEMYRHEKYNPAHPAHNTALAIFKNEDAAQKIIGASPLRLERQPQEEGWGARKIPGRDGSAAESSADSTEPPLQAPPFQPRQGVPRGFDLHPFLPQDSDSAFRKHEGLTQRQEFRLLVSPSHLDHQAVVERQHYYAGFRPDPSTIMAADLKDRVPLPAMVDCHMSKKEVPNRIRAKRARSNDIMGQQLSLRAMWERGQRAKETKDATGTQGQPMNAG